MQQKHNKLDKINKNQLFVDAAAAGGDDATILLSLLLKVNKCYVINCFDTFNRKFTPLFFFHRKTKVAKDFKCNVLKYIEHLCDVYMKLYKNFSQICLIQSSLIL